MKNLILLTILTSFNFIFSQNLDYDNKYESIEICNAIQGKSFTSKKAADNALDKILSVIGATKRFVLQECANINNAVALTYNGVRYIMYDPEFMNQLNYSNDWSKIFILAHEVGHHINGHSIDVILGINGLGKELSLSEKRTQELEADEFAGFVLGRLGASLSQAQSAIKSISNNEDDTYSTHPNKTKRLSAIKRGYNESGGKVGTTGIGVSKGKIIDSPYSNSRYSNVKYVQKSYSNGVYEGYVSVNSNKPFGYGEYRTDSGFKYNGEWSNGSYNGYGKQSWANGDSFEGYFVDDIRTGEGVYLYGSGEKHFGTFANNSLVKGTKITPNGIINEGFWIDNNPINVTIKGDNFDQIRFGFLDGSKGNGYTTLTLWDGVKIKGSFINGSIRPQIGMLGSNDGTSEKRNFIGKYRTHKKAKELPTYITDFIPNFLVRELGINKAWEIDYFDNRVYVYNWEPVLNRFIESEGSFAYKKDFSDKQQIWNLKYLIGYSESSIEEHLKENFSSYGYVGNTFGFGEIFWPDGSYYKGYIHSGGIKKGGYGEIFYGKNDEREYYKGIWWNDKKNGYGILKYKNGTIEKGVFRNNQFFENHDFDFENMQKALIKWR